MRGWKTYIASAGMIAYGVGGFIGGVHDADTAIKLVLAGMGLAGIGHKIDKISKSE